MELKAYLDNAATTKPFKCVQDIMIKTLTEDFGNPSSLHIKGMDAERYVKDAAKTIAATLKAQEKEIVFTSGGTESNNMAIIGTALANKRRGNHIITTKMEHASVYRPVFFLEEHGFRATYLDVDRNGRIDLAELEQAVGEDTILVSVMMVNNEVGSILDVENIAKTVKAKNAAALVHVDAIQAYGKMRISPQRMGIDLLSVSAHKIHGPKGVGFLYIRDKTKIHPIIFGGEQQKGMRSGTENVPGIAGLSAAAKEAYFGFEEKVAKLYELKRYFIEGVQEIDDTYINALEEIPPEQTAPHIVSVGFRRVRSEVLLHALSAQGICVSSGSACASNHPNISSALKAIGVKNDLLESTIRFSFSVMTTKEELTYTLKTIASIVPQLRKYTRF